MVTKELSEITRRFYKDGISDEEFVMHAVTDTLGGDVRKASRTEDIEDHIDFWWNSPKKGWIGVDVKGLNRSKRSDSSYDDKIHWLELRNVKGKEGWLCGKAEYIAFRTLSKIIFVKRDKLLEFAQESIKGKEVVYDTPKECYVPYKRLKWGRDDLSLKALNSDLEKLSHFCIECN